MYGGRAVVIVARVRVAALYDIHGNLPALDAVLADVEAAEADVVLIGGDVASGPMPRATLERLDTLRERVRYVRGNADRVLDFAGTADAGDHQRWVRSRRWVAEQLGEERLAFLRELPLDVVVDVEGLGKVRFCHGSPGSDVEPITRVTSHERLRRLLQGVRERVVVCGHTHMQFDRTVGSVRVVNAGSVGAPYEAESGAYWLLAVSVITLRRTAYDVEDAAWRIRATGYPNADTFADELLSAEPSRPERMSVKIEALADGSAG